MIFAELFCNFCLDLQHLPILPSSSAGSVLTISSLKTNLSTWYLLIPKSISITDVCFRWERARFDSWLDSYWVIEIVIPQMALDCGVQRSTQLFLGVGWGAVIKPTTTALLYRTCLSRERYRIKGCASALIRTSLMGEMVSNKGYQMYMQLCMFVSVDLWSSIGSLVLIIGIILVSSYSGWWTFPKRLEI